MSLPHYLLLGFASLVSGRLMPFQNQSVLRRLFNVESVGGYHVVESFEFRGFDTRQTGLSYDLACAETIPPPSQLNAPAKAGSSQRLRNASLPPTSAGVFPSAHNVPAKLPWIDRNGQRDWSKTPISETGQQAKMELFGSPTAIAVSR